jgi:hypothetical protein
MPIIADGHLDVLTSDQDVAQAKFFAAKSQFTMFQKFSTYFARALR